MSLDLTKIVSQASSMVTRLLEGRAERQQRLQYARQIFGDEAIDLENLASGYAFFEDFLWRAHRSGARMTEIPITFTDRKLGESKANGIEMIRGARDLIRLAVHTWFKC